MTTLTLLEDREVWEPSVPLAFIEPESVRVLPVPNHLLRRYQRGMSRAVWRPSPGRNLSFFVTHGDITIGIAFLASPVFNLGCRDKHLALPTEHDEKGSALRSYADLSVCVASQPIGWHWNLGKLIALVAPTLGDFWFDAYGDELRGITTTSLWGKGSQYNRIYKFLGYTVGYGHEHVDDDRYQEMHDRVFDGTERIKRPHYLTNGRMRVIQEYARLEGDDVNRSVFHGNKRGVYYHEAVDPLLRKNVISAWYERWGLPRYERTRGVRPPYTTGKHVTEQTPVSAKPKNRSSVSAC